MTRITPGGPADEAGLKMGDKILQVRSEKDPQDGTMCMPESRAGAEHQEQCSSYYC